MRRFLAINKFIAMRGGGILSPFMMLVVFSSTAQRHLAEHDIDVSIIPMALAITVLVWVVGWIDRRWFFGHESRYVFDHMKGDLK